MALTIKCTLTVTLLLSVACSTAFAQREPQLMLFGYNQLLFNPAYTGIEGRPVAGLTGHITDPYTNGPGSTHPTYNVYNGAIMYDQPLEKISSGIGVVLSGFGTEYGNETSLGVNYAYHKKLGEEKVISVGAQAALRRNFRKNYNWGYGPYSSNESSKIFPDFTLGVRYQVKQFYAGISVEHLFKPAYIDSKYDYFFMGPDFHKKTREVYLSAGADIKITDKFRTMPSLLVYMPMYKGNNFCSSLINLNNTFVLFDILHLGGTIHMDTDYFRYTEGSLNAGFELKKKYLFMLGAGPQRGVEGQPFDRGEVRLQVKL